MGQAAAFLNGLVKGVDTTHRWKKDRADLDRQAKQDAEDDSRRENEKKYTAERAAINPMQDIEDEHAAMTAERTREQKALQQQNEATAAMAKTPLSPVAAGIPGASIPKPAFNNQDVFAKPEKAIPASIVRSGIPSQAPEFQAAEKRQPTIGDALRYQQRLLELDRKYGRPIGDKMLELANMRKKIEDEGFGKAVNLLHSGNYDAGVKAFNETGKSKWSLDPASPPKQGFVIVGGEKVPTHLITVKNHDGQTRVINTANDLRAMMDFEKAIKLEQEGTKIKNAYDVGMTNAEGRIAAAKATKAPNVLSAKKAGVGALDIAYGIKRDAMGEILNPSVLSSTQKSQYFKDAAAIAALVDQGSDPWAAAEQITGKTLRSQEEAKVVMPGNSKPAADVGNPSKYESLYK